jgi:DNA polymerase-4
VARTPRGNVARRLKAQIREATGLTASAGVAPNKFLAKIASGWRKPDGLTVVAPDRVEAFLQQLAVDALWGVGPVTAARLRRIGLERLVDVRRADPDLLRRTIGSHAAWLIDLSRGIDDRPVEPLRPRKSVGTELVFPEDLRDRARIEAELAGMAEEDAGWLARKGLFARTVTIKVRYGDFTTITRSDTRLMATREGGLLAQRAVALLDRTEAGPARCASSASACTAWSTIRSRRPRGGPAGGAATSRSTDVTLPATVQRDRGARTRSAAGITRMSTEPRRPAGSPST